MHRRRPFGMLRALAIVGSALALAAGSVGPAAAVDPTRTLVPIGSDYQADTLELFAAAAAAHDAATDTNKRVVILVLPITYSLSATSSKNGERQKNLTLADNRRGMVETACNAVKASGPDLRRATRPGPGPRRRVPRQQPRVLHAGRGRPVHPGWRPDGRHGRGRRHPDGSAHGRGLRGRCRRRRQQRR